MRWMILLLYATIFVFGAFSTAKADLIRLDWDMRITSADPLDLYYNWYGLGIGDTFSADAIFEDSGLSGIGEEFIYFNNPINTMDFNPPSIPQGIFNETVATDPFIRLMNGSPIEISYLLPSAIFIIQEDLSEAQVYGYPARGAVHLSVIDQSFYLTDREGRTLTGTYENFTLSPVPEPGTMLLIGSGIIGLSVFRRKFKRR